MATKKAKILTRSASGARLLPTNVPGIYTFGPSGNIDYRKSGPKGLLRNAIPARPKGKGKAIESAERVWDRILSQRYRHIPPILDIAPRRSQVPPRPRVKARNGLVNSDFNNDDIWSGGAMVAAAGERLLSAWANWVVPTVNRPSGSPDTDGPWKSSAWVGLDGWGNSDVLQGGTEHDVVPGSDGDEVSYYAWYEWFPFLSFKFTSFAVAPGDAIFCFIHFDGKDALQVDYGSVRLLNLTNRTETSVYIAMPGPVDLPGGFLAQTAECIMERPSMSLPSGGLVPYQIPHYGEVTFSSFGACSDLGNAYTAFDLTTIGLASGGSSGERGEAIVCRPVK